MIDRKTVLLTGVPRSGTTLACFLLNKLHDVVALDEPLDIARTFRSGSDKRMLAEIHGFASRMRHSIATRGIAVSKQIDGRVVDNHADQVDAEGLASFSGQIGDVQVSDATENCLLVIKHPFQFTAQLELLSTEFPVFAVIRNPLSVLGSWNRVKFPIRSGRNPLARLMTPALFDRLERCEDRLDRQITYLDWYFEQYQRFLPQERVIRYEEMVGSGGRSLEMIASQAGNLSETLRSRDDNEHYNRSLLADIADRLSTFDGQMWHYYSRSTLDI